MARTYDCDGCGQARAWPPHRSGPDGEYPDGLHFCFPCVKRGERDEEKWRREEVQAARVQQARRLSAGDGLSTLAHVVACQLPPEGEDDHGPCWQCGERIAVQEATALLASPHCDHARLVHAEPCGTDLLADGWTVA